MNNVCTGTVRRAARKGVVALLGLLLAGAGWVHAAGDAVHLETCLVAASAVKAGDYLKVEYLSVSPRGVPTYEIEVRGADGREWELMCDTLTGAIYEIEQEANGPSDPLFLERAKVSEEEARAKVLGLYPGKIEEVEYELESNGDPSYEIDLVTADGTEFKIEVDAASGDIIEVSVEAWEIGQEANERVE